MYLETQIERKVIVNSVRFLTHLPLNSCIHSRAVVLEDICILIVCDMTLSGTLITNCRFVDGLVLNSKWNGSGMSKCRMWIISGYSWRPSSLSATLGLEGQLSMRQNLLLSSLWRPPFCITSFNT